MAKLLAGIDPALVEAAQGGSLQAKEALMEAHLQLAGGEGVGSIDRMKYLFAAQDLASELLRATGDARFQHVVESCQGQTSDTMTEGIVSRLPKFLRKKF